MTHPEWRLHYYYNVPYPGPTSCHHSWIQPGEGELTFDTGVGGQVDVAIIYWISHQKHKQQQQKIDKLNYIKI